MVKDSKAKRMEETLMKGILGDRAWEELYPHVPTVGLAIDKAKIDVAKIDPAKMKAFFQTLPKQEVDDIIARASKSSAPEAKMVIDVARGIR